MTAAIILIDQGILKTAPRTNINAIITIIPSAATNLLLLTKFKIKFIFNYKRIKEMMKINFHIFNVLKKLTTVSVSPDTTNENIIYIKIKITKALSG